MREDIGPGTFGADFNFSDDEPKPVTQSRSPMKASHPKPVTRKTDLIASIPVIMSAMIVNFIEFHQDQESVTALQDRLTPFQFPNLAIICCHSVPLYLETDARNAGSITGSRISFQIVTVLNWADG